MIPTNTSESVDLNFRKNPITNNGKKTVNIKKAAKNFMKLDFGKKFNEYLINQKPLF